MQDAEGSATEHHNALEHDQSIAHDLNAFYFTDMADLDPFDMFDPTFDLHGIDACLEGNLDLAIPIHLQ
jgi:hypothetical protein